MDIGEQMRAILKAVKEDMMSIKYQIYNNNMNKNCKYSAKIINSDTIGAKDIIKRMIEYGSTVTIADIVAVIEVLASTINSFLAEGKRVNLFDIVHIYPVISGKFKDMNDDFDKDKHKIEIKSCSGKRLKKITYQENSIVKENIPKPSPMIMSFDDIESGTVSNVLSSKNIGVINGKNLKINTTYQDEGVFLINQSQNIEIRISKFQKNAPMQLVFWIPPLNSNIYNIEVRSRVRCIKELRKSDWRIELKSG